MQWGLLAAVLIAAASGEATMSVTYERSGGFAGMSTRVEIADGKTLKLKDRRAGEVSRALSAAEQKTLQDHLEKVRKAAPPATKAPRASDSFHHKLSLDGKLRVDLATTAQHPEQDGSPDAALMGFLDS